MLPTTGCVWRRPIQILASRRQRFQSCDRRCRSRMRMPFRNYGKSLPKYTRLTSTPWSLFGRRRGRVLRPWPTVCLGDQYQALGDVVRPAERGLGEFRIGPVGRLSLPFCRGAWIDRQQFRRGTDFVDCYQRPQCDRGYPCSLVVGRQRHGKASLTHVGTYARNG